jgi:hypothetical protein
MPVAYKVLKHGGTEASEDLARDSNFLRVPPSLRVSKVLDFVSSPIACCKRFKLLDSIANKLYAMESAQTI